MRPRTIEPLIRRDLDQKMVFLAGPRQVGKTTLSKKILGTSLMGHYFTWDKREDRRKILNAQWPPGSALIVLDEIHKYRRWKTWIKGEYDVHHPRLRFLVTGSARLDIYRKGGDSLQGRYHHYRLHPFSLNELEALIPVISPGSELQFRNRWDPKALKNLLHYGGFPEPISAQDESMYRRWNKERLDRFFREDVRDLENVRELSQMEMLSDMLPERVGSLLSLNALREDLEVSHRAVSHWMEILERLYFAYRIYPFFTKKFHGLRKEPKAYLWDWAEVDEPAARLENLVASHLLKACHYLEDAQGYDAELFFLRDMEKREVDFLVTIDHKPWFCVEVKMTPNSPSRHLRYFSTRLQTPFNYQIHLEGDQDYQKDDIRVMPVGKFLTALP